MHLSMVLIILKHSFKTVFVLNWASVQNGEVIVGMRCCRDAAMSPDIHNKLAAL